MLFFLEMCAPLSNFVHIRVLIAHTNELVIESLRTALSQMDCVETVVDCLTLEEARTAINHYQPQLILLNEALIKKSKVRISEKTNCLIFLFRVEGAQDFFVYEGPKTKMYSLAEVVSETQKRMKLGISSNRQVHKTIKIVAKRSPHRRHRKIAFKAGRRLVVLNSEDLIWLEKEDKGTLVHTRLESFKTSYPLESLVHFPQRKFLIRVSGRAAINLNNVMELRMTRGNTVVHLKDGPQVRVAPRYLHALRKMIETFWKASA
ncbi:MAG: hypothetical protein JWO13_377 [Acidobacteriales bacterium]|nr:hypothetical protein [Terriglobales bacterium]